MKSGINKTLTYKIEKFILYIEIKFYICSIKKIEL